MILNSLYSLIATLGFGVLCNIRGKNLIFAAIGGGIGWFVYLYFSSILNTSTFFAFFIASLAGSIYSEIMARVLKAPATTFVICALIPLVPGGGMYNAMFEYVQGNLNQSFILGVQTLSIAGCIAVGVFLVSSVSKMSTLLTFKIKKKKHIRT